MIWTVFAIIVRSIPYKNVYRECFGVIHVYQKNVNTFIYKVLLYIGLIWQRITFPQNLNNAQDAKFARLPAHGRARSSLLVCFMLFDVVSCILILVSCFIICFMFLVSVSSFLSRARPPPRTWPTAKGLPGEPFHFNTFFFFWKLEKSELPFYGHGRNPLPFACFELILFLDSVSYIYIYIYIYIEEVGALRQDTTHCRAIYQAWRAVLVFQNYEHLNKRTLVGQNVLR